jgi:hypothetical protein
MEAESTSPKPKIIKSYCRQCGGERNHSILVTTSKDYSDDEVSGNDTWSVLECCGCETVTFEHSHWFSEDYEYNEPGYIEVNVYRDLYPPAPTRKLPEWGINILMSVAMDQLWVFHLHADIYKAIGLKSYMLAAMGTRTIIDHVVTWKAGLGDGAFFKKKLEKMFDLELIKKQQLETIYAAFDAGSAVSHRGHTPTEEDVFTLLDIAEEMMQKFFIAPVREAEQAEKAAKLKARTPQRGA